MESSTPAPGTAPGGQPPPLDLNKLIDRYVQLRDRKRSLEQQHKDQLAPFVKLMDEIEGTLLSYMQHAGIDSVATPGGTAYQTTLPRASIRDAAAFREWVIAQNEFDMVDWRANARAVFDYIQANNGVQPPGVNPSTYTKVNFRRPNED